MAVTKLGLYGGPRSVFPQQFGLKTAMGALVRFISSRVRFMWKRRGP